ncbi:MAG TPA: SAM-dependent methyltransferase [Clostridiaceae bacterium]|nr:SAM-dependent methyltransferase [Clostridiaceae bacterium]
MKYPSNIKNNVSKRILALIHWIKPDSFVIDVGTDHAYLPIALIDRKITRNILAIDNNIKPLAKARHNIHKAGYADFIELRINDGLSNISFAGDEIIVIAGMGGVLISKILAEAKSRFQQNQVLILQPNWTWYELRKWLAENGFQIEQEQVIKEQNKFYSQLLVKYTGKKYTITDTEAFCGININLDINYGLDSDSLKRETDTVLTIYLEYLLRLKHLAERKSRSIVLYHKVRQNIESLLLNLSEK